MILPRATSARRELPAVDDHVVVPESHTEMIDGVVYETMEAKEPHANLHQGGRPRGPSGGAPHAPR